MPGKGQYSKQYSPFNPTSIVFAAPGADGAVWAHGTLTTQGVTGAQPRPLERYTHKGQYEQPTLAKVFAEAGMQPRQFTPKNPRNVPDFQLDITDIAGTQPHPKDWYYLTARGTNPLDPEYRLPSAKAEPAPEPKFLRDPLNISDIDGTKARSETRPQRELRSLTVNDIPGAQPGKPAYLRQSSLRNPLDVTDICVHDPSFQEKHQQMAQHGTPRAGALSPCNGSPGCAGYERQAYSAPPVPSARLSDVGVVKSLEWRRQQFEALREQGEALREARAAADSTMESRGAQIASATALSVLLKGFKTLDKDRSGRLRESEFAAVLKHASLGLSHQEVSKLVGGLRDTNGLVDYKPFMGKLFARAQYEKQAAWSQQRAGDEAFTASVPAHLSVHLPGTPGRAARAAAAAAEEIQMPNWAAARQRRLSTAVALTLNQQPAATASEAASLQTPQPWHNKSPRRFSMSTRNPTAPRREGGMRPGSAGQQEGAPGLDGEAGGIKPFLRRSSVAFVGLPGLAEVREAMEGASSPWDATASLEGVACTWAGEEDPLFTAALVGCNNKDALRKSREVCTLARHARAASSCYPRAGESSGGGSPSSIPRRTGVATPKMPAVREAGSVPRATGGTAGRAQGSPGRLLPVLPHSAPAQMARPRAEEMAAERVCKSVAAEEVSLVRSLK